MDGWMDGSIDLLIDGWIERWIDDRCFYVLTSMGCIIMIIWIIYVESSSNNIQLFLPSFLSSFLPLQLDTSIDKKMMNRCSRPRLTIETSSDSRPSPESTRCIIVSDTLLYESCYQVGMKAYR
jgi:hypothetical protein